MDLKKSINTCGKRNCGGKDNEEKIERTLKNKDDD